MRVARTGTVEGRNHPVVQGLSAHFSNFHGNALLTFPIRLCMDSAHHSRQSESTRICLPWSRARTPSLPARTRTRLIFPAGPRQHCVPGRWAGSALLFVRTSTPSCPSSDRRPLPADNQKAFTTGQAEQHAVHSSSGAPRRGGFGAAALPDVGRARKLQPRQPPAFVSRQEIQLLGIRFLLQLYRTYGDGPGD
jgi:hypothetical protein